MLFPDPFLIMVYIVYLISFFIHWTILISIMCILLEYLTQNYIVHLTSYFNRHIVVFS